MLLTKVFLILPGFGFWIIFYIYFKIVNMESHPEKIDLEKEFRKESLKVIEPKYLYDNPTNVREFIERNLADQKVKLDPAEIESFPYYISYGYQLELNEEKNADNKFTKFCEQFKKDLSPAAINSVIKYDLEKENSKLYDCYLKALLKIPQTIEELVLLEIIQNKNQYLFDVLVRYSNLHWLVDPILICQILTDYFENVKGKVFKESAKIGYKTHIMSQIDLLFQHKDNL